MRRRGRRRPDIHSTEMHGGTLVIIVPEVIATLLLSILPEDAPRLADEVF